MNTNVFSNTSAPVIIELKNIVKTYYFISHEIHALQGIDLKIRVGDFIAIAGSSGSGKSTLLNIISMLDTPTSGEVYCDGEDVCAMTDKVITRFRSKKVGLIFQNYNLIPVLNVLENVAFPLQIQSVKRSECLRKAKDILSQVGLSGHLEHRPAKLSGGQRQRVAIARALITEPEVVIADEPTAALDSKTGMEIIDLMRSLNESARTTFIFSTHDPRITSCVNNVLELMDGKLQYN